MKCRHCGSELETPLVDLGSAPPSNAYLTESKLHAPEKWFPLRVLVCGKKKLPKRDAKNTLLAVPSGYAVPRGFDAVVCGRNGRVQPKRLLKKLHERGVRRVLLEGGPTLLGSFFKSDVVDQVALFIGPKLAGAGRRPVDGWHVTSMNMAMDLRHIREERVGDTIVVEGLL